MQLRKFEAALLQVRAYFALRTVVRKVLKKYNLNVVQWIVMELILLEPNISMTKIAKTLAVSKPQISALMVELENLNYLEVEKSDNDRRRRILKLTAVAQAILGPLNQALDKELSKMLEGIDESDMHAYIKVKGKIVENFVKF